MERTGVANGVSGSLCCLTDGVGETAYSFCETSAPDASLTRMLQNWVQMTMDHRG